LLIDGVEPAPAMTTDVHAALRAVLHDPDFPCVGAKSVVNQASYRFGLYSELAGADATAGLALDLCRFGCAGDAVGGEFRSFIACFKEPKLRSMVKFEALLWQQLAALHDLDKQHFDWNPEVSRDPNDASFSFSFAGGAYFVVGLSPASRRWARRFPWPTLVFNDHFQFQRLREAQRFDRIRDVIRERDEALHGTPNAMLEDHGAHSEARQYSGRTVRSDWRCPVQFD
jgi:FPC/CPF motif-containing protein YcgG